MRASIDYFKKAYSGGLLKQGKMAVHEANEAYISLSDKKTVKLITEDSEELQGGAITMIWAENLEGLVVGSVFGFGNGSNSANGITITHDCTLVGVSLTTDTNATGIVEVYKNGVSVAVIDINNDTSSYYDLYQSIPEPFSAGDTLNFQCTNATLAGTNARVVASLATLGIRGEDGVDGQDGASSYTDAEIKQMYENNPDTNAFTDYAQSKLSTIESNATADQTSAEIKALYESEADTNAFTDAEKAKLATIEEGADDIDALTLEVRERDYTTRTALAYHIHQGHI